MKVSFKNDYSEGCHPKILQALVDSNETQTLGYGQDYYTTEAIELFRKIIKKDKASIFFVSGGTQANILVISYLLKSYESVISAESGHVQTNETGAIETTGHKINLIPSYDGKISSISIKKILDAHRNAPHQVKPRLVYISNTTELGTHYTKTELEELYQFCQQHQLLLFIDGARLSQAIAIKEAELSMDVIAKNCDVFYFGGTKNGALIGEAIIFNNHISTEEFPFVIKQRGAMLAKGRLLAIQFLELLKNDLYLHLARHANGQSQKIKQAFQRKNIQFLTDSQSNQIFPIVKNGDIDILQKQFDFYVWQPVDKDHSAIRLISSWATTDDNVQKMIADINQLE